MMEYKGYVANVSYDDDARLFHGEVVNTRAVITFQGRSVDELEAELKKSVDVYLEWCKKRKKAPERPYSGTFTVRVTPDVHRAVAIAAAKAKKSLNSWVADTIWSASQR